MAKAGIGEALCFTVPNRGIQLLPAVTDVIAVGPGERGRRLSGGKSATLVLQTSHDKKPFGFCARNSSRPLTGRRELTRSSSGANILCRAYSSKAPSSFSRTGPPKAQGGPLFFSGVVPAHPSLSYRTPVVIAPAFLRTNSSASCSVGKRSLREMYENVMKRFKARMGRH